MKSKSLDSVLLRIGFLLYTLRIQKGYSTLKEFVHRYDLPLIQYWKIEKGKSNMTMKTLARILAIHRMSLEDFFCQLKEDEP